MKDVLISVQPKWVEKIASGEKTIEVLKTKPKLETPFKCYIYCTIAKEDKYILERHENGFITRIDGKVVGEFICDRIDTWEYKKIITLYGKTNGYFIFEDDFQAACLTYDALMTYGNGKTLYGWHISNLKFYNKPKELREFRNTKGEPITRAFQSWGYVNAEID